MYEENESDHSFPSQFREENETNDEYAVGLPKCYKNELPVEFLAFLTLVLFKLAGFHISIVLKFINLPFSLFNFCWTMVMLPSKTLVPLVKEHVSKLLPSNRSLLKLGLRFCWAMFWSVYGFLILVGLFIMGFVIGGIMIRYLVREPIQTTENLNFDYTKTSPVAFVPLVSTPIIGVSPSLISKDKIPFPKSVRGRFIPSDHKLKLTVSLTMPESKYNRNLGIFQVRVECLSANGKVTASSSYPSMLKYKSEPIRIIETMLKTVPLITGFQSEIQHIKIQEIEFREGYEPTACFKVIIEQRAEYEAGFGIPEIYAASLHIESDLSPLKRLMWNWRRTVFVWISIISSLIELSIALIFFRPIIFPGKTLLRLCVTAKNHGNKIMRN